MKKHIKGILITLILIMTSLVIVSYASSTDKGCTHKVYSTSSPSKYHYSYCKKCGKCNKRTRHSISEIRNYGNGTYHTAYCSCGYYMGRKKHSFSSFSKYNSDYHYASCSCGYTGLKKHNGSSKVKITLGETILGTTYSSVEDIDLYHRVDCGQCGEILGVEEHTWSGGDTTAHRCSSCSYEHSKKDDATKGLHYFDLDKISKVGDVANCEVCGEALHLKYSSDSDLPKLPKKEEYTMVGNPNPMEEVEINKDQKIISNFMPLNEDGEIIPLNEDFLRVRTYTHGNYFRHYSKLVGEQLSDITGRVNYTESKETLEYITNKLSELEALGGYNESQKIEIVNDINNVIKNDPSIGYIDTYAVTTVISQLGDFAIESIRSPLIDWFRKDLTIRNTWLAGDMTTLRHEFFGSMGSSQNREYVIYFTELPAAKYEIVLSPLLTDGITFNIFSYSLGGLATLSFSTLFTRGGGGGSDSPSNIKAYISIAYRDMNGNVIYDKVGNLATPKDTAISKTVYSGTSAKKVTTNVSAEMEWTQLNGYRYKGYLIKYR